MTEEELEEFRRNFGPSNPEPVDLEEFMNSSREERRCRDCNQLFTPQEPHHRLCYDCWMGRYRAWEIRTFPNLHRHQDRVSRGNFDDDD